MSSRAAGRDKSECPEEEPAWAWVWLEPAPAPLPVASFAAGGTFAAQEVSPPFSGLDFAAADMLASPESNSALAFASLLAVGQTSAAKELELASFSVAATAPRLLSEE